MWGLLCVRKPEVQRDWAWQKVEDGKSEDLGWSHYEHCLENMNDVDVAWVPLGKVSLERPYPFKSSHCDSLDIC